MPPVDGQNDQNEEVGAEYERLRKGHRGVPPTPRSGKADRGGALERIILSLLATGKA
jgi:hypothetical protein